MKQIKGISKELIEKISKECEIKKALQSVRDAANEKRTEDRRKIEDIKIMRELEQSYSY